MKGLLPRAVLSLGALLITGLCASCAVAEDVPAPQPPVSQYTGGPIAAPPADPGQQPSSRWPLRLDGPDGLITVYQPQLTTFDGNQLKARAAVSVVPPGQQDPTFGVMWMESRVSTDRAARTVQILDVTVTRARFPGPGGVSEQVLTNAMRSYNAQQGVVTLSLDQLLSMLEVVQKEKAAVKDISTDPPKILFVNHPAVLVQYDGPPKLMQVQNSGLIRAVNTPFFVVLDPPTKTYFLKGGSLWYAGANPAGPFQPAGQVPQEVSALATTSGYQDPQAAIQGAPASAIEIITATEPTELVWTDGAEEMGTVPNTDLLYVTNTPSDVFLLIDTQQIFVLISGRWYTAPNHNGPWTYIPADKLPPDFARIPPNSEKGSVLAHVAGTQQAMDAIVDTYVPQTAAIDRRSFEQPVVQYDGEPQFESIQETPVSYCVNTPNSVLRVRNQYYCCYNGVWYLSSVAVGPWEICTSVPTEIYTIPPSCPVYSVRYCYVYESTPDLVYVGYTPGYVGCYPYNHVVVYGTGFYYRPWVGRVYYPRPWTYGFAARYDAYSGHWGFEVGYARGGGDAWLGEREHRSAGGWFGHGGYRPVVVHNEVNLNIREPRANRVEITRSDYDLYDRRKDVRRDFTPVRAEERRSPEIGRINPTRTEPGRQAPTRYQPPERNNVYAGENGQVYRKTIDGWEQRDNNKWVPRTGAPERGAAETHVPAHEQPTHEAPVRESPVREQPARERPVQQEPVRQQPAREAPAREAPSPELNQDYRARVAGQQRAHNYPQQEPVRQAPVREAPAREAPAHETPPPRQAGGRNIESSGGEPHGSSSPGPRQGPGPGGPNSGQGQGPGNPRH